MLTREDELGPCPHCGDLMEVVDEAPGDARCCEACAAKLNEVVDHCASCGCPIPLRATPEFGGTTRVVHLLAMDEAFLVCAPRRYPDPDPCEPDASMPGRWPRRRGQRQH